MTSLIRILFVCSGSAYRSPVAEVLLRKLKPAIETDLAGVDPASLTSEVARRFVAREDAQQLLKKAPEGLDNKDIGKYDPCFLPHGHAERIFWQIK